MKPYADEIVTDAIGNLIALKKGQGSERSKKIMYAAHMDEIGFMVKQIEPEGRLRVCNMGCTAVGTVLFDTFSRVLLSKYRP